MLVRERIQGANPGNVYLEAPGKTVTVTGRDEKGAYAVTLRLTKIGGPGQSLVFAVHGQDAVLLGGLAEDQGHVRGAQYKESAGALQEMGGAFRAYQLSHPLDTRSTAAGVISAKDTGTPSAGASLAAKFAARSQADKRR